MNIGATLTILGNQLNNVQLPTPAQLEQVQHAAALAPAINELGQFVQELLQSQRNLATTLLAQTQALQALRGEVQALRGDVQGLPAAVQALQGQVQGLEGQVQNLQGQEQRSMARAANARVASVLGPLTPLQTIAGQAPPDFPAIRNDLDRMDAAHVVALLQAYGQPVQQGQNAEMLNKHALSTYIGIL